MKYEKKVIGFEQALVGVPNFRDFLRQQFGARVTVGMYESSGDCALCKMTFPILLDGETIGNYSYSWNIDGDAGREYKGKIHGFYGDKEIHLEWNDEAEERIDSYTDIPFQGEPE